LVFRGRLGRTDIASVCEKARPLLTDGDPGMVVCDVRGVVEPDAVTIDALARLQLTARRLGHEVQIRHASHQLQQLFEFAGLQDVLLLES
jgi:ABC-type transporter Mla MlaB component